MRLWHRGADNNRRASSPVVGFPCQTRVDFRYAGGDENFVLASESRFGGTCFSLSSRRRAQLANAGLPPGDKLKHVPRRREVAVAPAAGVRLRAIFPRLARPGRDLVPPTRLPAPSAHQSSAAAKKLQRHVECARPYTARRSLRSLQVTQFLAERRVGSLSADCVGLFQSTLDLLVEDALVS